MRAGASQTHLTPPPSTPSDPQEVPHRQDTWQQLSGQKDKAAGQNPSRIFINHLVRRDAFRRTFLDLTPLVLLALSQNRTDRWPPGRKETLFFYLVPLSAMIFHLDRQELPSRSDSFILFFPPCLSPKQQGLQFPEHSTVRRERMAEGTHRLQTLNG